MLIQVAACVLLTLWALSSMAMAALSFISWPEYTASMEEDPVTTGRPRTTRIGVALVILAAPITLPVCFIRGVRKARSEAEAEWSPFTQGGIQKGWTAEEEAEWR